MIDNISIKELKKLNNILLIDIRDGYKYNQNHILDAKNIPFQKLLLNPDKYLKKNFNYYIYCQKGNNSKMVCNILKNNGFLVTNIIGGYEAWILNQ